MKKKLLKCVCVLKSTPFCRLSAQPRHHLQGSEAGEPSARLKGLRKGDQTASLPGFISSWRENSSRSFAGGRLRFLEADRGGEQDVDVLRDPRVRGPGDHSEQGPRPRGRLLVPRRPHVRAPHRNVSEY